MHPPTPARYLLARSSCALAFPLSTAERYQRIALARSLETPSPRCTCVAKVDLGNGMPLPGGLPAPVSRFGVVPGHATTVVMDIAKSDQGSPVALVRRETVPIDGLCDVPGNADTAVVQRPKPGLRLGRTTLGEFGEQFQRQWIVFRRQSRIRLIEARSQRLHRMASLVPSRGSTTRHGRGSHSNQGRLPRAVDEAHSHTRTSTRTVSQRLLSPVIACRRERL